jgi:hypothetical protein
MDRFEDYHDAYDAARIKADTLKMNVAITRRKWFNENGFTVTIASREDYNSEIVVPGSSRIAH